MDVEKWWIILMICFKFYVNYILGNVFLGKIMLNILDWDNILFLFKK